VATFNPRIAIKLWLSKKKRRKGRLCQSYTPREKKRRKGRLCQSYTPREKKHCSEVTDSVK